MNKEVVKSLFYGILSTQNRVWKGMAKDLRKLIIP